MHLDDLLSKSITVSRSRYQLNLATLPEGTHSDFIDIFTESAAILKGFKDVQKQKCKRTRNYYGIRSCNPCDVPQLYSKEQLLGMHGYLRDSCPNLEYYPDFPDKATSCYECIDQKLGYSKKFTCDDIDGSMAISHGTFDTVILWRVPDEYWGTHATMALQDDNSDFFEDILSIPCNRVRWPWEVEGWKTQVWFSRKIILLIFILPKRKRLGEDGGEGYRYFPSETLKAIRNDLLIMKGLDEEDLETITRCNPLSIRNDDQAYEPRDPKRLELFLTYSYFPLMLKAEFDTEQSAHQFLLDLRKVDGIDTTSTVYCVNTRDFTISVRDDKLAEQRSGERSSYLLAVKVKKEGFVDRKQVFENRILNIIQGVIEEYNEEHGANLRIGIGTDTIQQISSDANGDSDGIQDHHSLFANTALHIRGFWDCIVPITSDSAIDILFFTTKYLRDSEGTIDRVITIPIWGVSGVESNGI